MYSVLSGLRWTRRLKFVRKDQCEFVCTEQNVCTLSSHGLRTVVANIASEIPKMPSDAYHPVLGMGGRGTYPYQEETVPSQFVVAPGATLALSSSIRPTPVRF